MAMIQAEVAQMNNRRVWLADTYLPSTDPDEIFGKEDGSLTPEQLFGVLAINALEEEWILDPELRAELSIITYADDNDDETD